MRLLLLLLIFSLVFAFYVESVEDDDGQWREANNYCFSCSQRRNSKDLYANPDDCHTFYQCFFVNSSYAIGFLHNCPPRQYWLDHILQCVPESLSSQCGDDPCSNGSLSCYADDSNCAAFFTCANSVSYRQCCPPTTRFNASICTCDFDAGCTDRCSQPDAPSTTQRPPPVIVDEQLICRDSFGNILRRIVTDPYSFIIYDLPLNASNEEIWDYVPEGLRKIYCPIGTSFDVETCACTNVHIRSPGDLPFSRCLLYLPFDDSWNDVSKSRFQTVDVGSIAIEKKLAARGSGSLATNGSGWLEIPGLKSIDFGQSASWCFFFKCAYDKCESGGVLSNNKDGIFSEFSIVVATEPDGRLTARVKFANPSVGVLNLVAPINNLTGTESGFNQVCIVYDGNVLNLFINKALVSSLMLEMSSSVDIGHCPYVIGTDQHYGGFTGYIDEVLICDHALSENDVAAHWSGQEAMQLAQLIPKINYVVYSGVPFQDDTTIPDPPIAPAILHYDLLTIYGGNRAIVGAYPFLALVNITFRSGYVTTCDGCLISSSWILTAAHCFTENSAIPAWTFALKSVKVFLGRYDLSVPQQDAVDRGYTYVVRHYFYSGTCATYGRCQEYDYALIKLDRPVTFNNRIQAVPLPETQMCNDGGLNSNAIDSCTSGTIIGWGLTQYGTTTIPMRADLSFRTRTDCGRPYSVVITDSQLCAGNGFPGPCRGDSGGPLTCQIKGRQYLVGLISWGAVDCGTLGAPSVFSRTCKVLQWIKDTMTRY